LAAPLGVCAALFVAAGVLHSYWSGWTSAVEEAGRAPHTEPPLSLPLPAAKPPDLAARVSPDAATRPAQPPAPVAGPIRVFIHHTAGAGNALPAMQLSAFLEVRGFEVAAIRSVEFPIDQPSVRYFFDGDRPRAERLMAAIGAFFAKDPDLAPRRAIGFTHVAPKPSEGDLEVWLRSAGTG
jgi:hypothetical protein